MATFNSSSGIELVELPRSETGNHPDTQELTFDAARESSTLGSLSSGEDGSARAWLAVAGAFFYLFPTYGMIHTHPQFLSPGPSIVR